MRIIANIIMSELVNGNNLRSSLICICKKESWCDSPSANQLLNIYLI